VIVHPAAGNWPEGAEDGVQALGLGVVAVRTTLDDEGWTSRGPNASGRNPVRDRFI
jgi:hypothetical protein